MPFRSNGPFAGSGPCAKPLPAPGPRRAAVRLLCTALAICVSQGPASAQQYLGITDTGAHSTPPEVTGYSGETEMWWTSEARTLLATGTAGTAPGMQRLKTDAAPIGNIVSQCYGWGGAHGTATGQCINRDDDGDVWFEVFFCDQEVEPPSGAFYACEGTIHAIGGSGKYRDITGGGTFAEYVLQITPDGMLVGYSPGEMTLTW